VAGVQGDQIGRMFLIWDIVYFGHLFLNTDVAPKIWVTFFSV
jgi:hypothetical protein